MGATIRLTASDGHEFDAYRADASGEVKGAVVVVQEVFGVNSHIRAVTDGFAAAGYDAIAPALFDRIRPGIELGYDAAGIEEGRGLAAQIGWDEPNDDIQAAATALRPNGRVGVVGYCWGGSWTWMAACRLPIGAAVCYYGRHIVDLCDLSPKCPVMMHFGAEDVSIPLENVDRIRERFPETPVFIYDDAQHGFNCDQRASWNEIAAAEARERTLGFFAQHLT